jgi:hypothetical protein
MTERKQAPEATGTPQVDPAVGSQVDLVLGPLFEKALVDFGVACRFGDTAARQGAAERIRAAARALLAAERERAARVCDDEYRIRADAGQKLPLYSESRGRCNAAAWAASNCALGVRGGEVV